MTILCKSPDGKYRIVLDEFDTLFLESQTESVPMFCECFPFFADWLRKCAKTEQEMPKVIHMETT